MQWCIVRANVGLVFYCYGKEGTESESRTFYLLISVLILICGPVVWVVTEKGDVLFALKCVA